MTRKKWTEEEEEALINKYSEMVASGALAKLMTREKKFLPICAHVNSIHHARDPQTFPWEWTWRDISIKIQNMRHQYMGVKQKIRKRKKRRKKDDGGGGGDGDDEGDNADGYDWEDGVNHWQNFLRYKEVFGDVDLGEKSECLNEDSDVLALGWYGDGLDGENELLGDESNREDGADQLRLKRKRWKENSGWRARVFSLLCTRLLEIRDLMVRREEREREGERERVSDGSGGGREQGFECEDRGSLWGRRAVERELKVERELEEERQRRMRMEEKREREEMEWRERMVSLQMDHEKQMMQMHAVACQNQMQILGVLVRLMYQLFGSGNDGLGGLNPMPSQVLQAMHHSEGMVSAEEKPEAHSTADFIVDD